jgi:hypothetical protein
MNIDPSKIGEEVAQTWRSSPLIVGMQMLMLIMIGSLIWDRYEQRRQVTPLVERMLDQIHEQALLLARCNNRPDRPEEQ